MGHHKLWQWLRRVAFPCLCALVITACSSPEDGRARGSGAGADVGNKAADFKPDSKVFK